MGRHIAIFALLNPGHVYPTLGLCSELVARGYRVTYPTIARFADQIRQTGAEPILVNAPELSSVEASLRYPPGDDPKFWHVLTAIFWPVYLITAARVVAAVEDFYGENVPDVILYDWPSFSGRILAHRLRCPAVQHFAHFAQRGYMIRIEGTCCNPEPTIHFARLVDSFLSAYGIESKDNLWRAEDLNIFFLPREFQFDGDLFDDRFCFVGPCLNRPTRNRWKSNSKGRPILLISESQATKEGNFIEICVKAFAESNYHVVFSVGENSTLGADDTLPTNFQINRNSYNIEILPHASLMICQGSTGTTLESLYHGVPVLVVGPRSPYHAEVAYRIAELGLGLQLTERDITAQRTRESVDQVLGDAELLNRVKRMQDSMKRSGGARAAAERIDRFLNGLGRFPETNRS